MSRGQKIRSFLLGLTLVIASVALFIFPEDGLSDLALFLSLTLVVRGVGGFIYYVSMARHMVGGKSILFYAVIYFDIGMFTLALSDIPRIYLALYLLSINGISALLELASGIDAMRNKAPSWKLATSHGIISLVLAIFCIAFIRQEDILVYIFSIGILYSGVIKLISAFRRTAIVYIQ